MKIINLIRSIFFGVTEDGKGIDKKKIREVIIDKKYQSFLKKLGKHMVWFNSLNDSQKKSLFMDWELFKKIHTDNIKSGLVSVGSNPSFKKFIYFSKSKRSYFIPKNVLRDKLIDSILDK